MESENFVIISKEEYEKIMKATEDISKLRDAKNKCMSVYINKPENKERLKAKRREYAKKNYDKNKNNEEYMQKKRDIASNNYYKKKNKEII